MESQSGQKNSLVVRESTALAGVRPLPAIAVQMIADTLATVKRRPDRSIRCALSAGGFEPARASIAWTMEWILEDVFGMKPVMDNLDLLPPSEFIDLVTANNVDLLVLANWHYYHYMERQHLERKYIEGPDRDTALAAHARFPVGPEFIAAIHAANPVAIIIISTMGNATKQGFLDAGAKAFLHAPPSMEELKAVCTYLRDGDHIPLK